MLCIIGKERGLVLPPGGGKGGKSCLHSIILHAADSAPHAESTTFSRKFGVRVGDI